MELGVRRRFQFSLKSLLFMIVVAAIMLAPLAWMFREKRHQELMARTQLQLALNAERRAFAAAEESRRRFAELDISFANNSGITEPATQGVMPQLKPARTNDDPTTLVKQLQQENAELKEKVELLRREVERLKAVNGR